MSDLKTKENNASVEKFLNSVEDKSKQKDCFEILKIMEEICGEKAKMWGKTMVGFGSYHYKYASGREGDWFLTGFSPRKNNLTIYIMPGFSDFPKLMSKLGKYTLGKSCLYFKKLEDLDLSVLKKLISQSLNLMEKRYPDNSMSKKK